MWLCRVAQGERESVNARVIMASRKAAATPGGRESGSEDRGPEARTRTPPRHARAAGTPLYRWAR